MGVPVLVLGESGTGKSASMRNFAEKDLKVINVANKPLPFKNKFESVSTDNYQKIIAELKMSKKKTIVIDDAQYLMANEFMRRATERGFDKFTEIAQNFWTLVNAVKDLPSDVIVYFMAHVERDANGNEKIKTIGKLLDEKITVEGMFTIVLKTNVTDGVYSFLTQNNGHDTTKSPIGMFSSYAIDNDLKFVDNKIRNYYELGEFLSDEDLAEIEETVKHGDIPIEEEKKGRKSRRGKAKEEESAETPAEEEKEEAKPKRRSRKKELEEEREKVHFENGVKLAEGSPLDPEGVAIPFEESHPVELKEMPKRKRRGKNTDTGTGAIVGATPEEMKELETATKEPEGETPEEQVVKPRRRRRV